MQVVLFPRPCCRSKKLEFFCLSKMQVCELRSGVVAVLLADALVAEAVVARECEERKTPAEVISASVAPTVAESRNMCAVQY